jgi:predicted amidohydrolase YtcJ
VAAGFRDALWPDQPHFALLDAVTGELPTYVLSGDLHAIWLNSAALAAAGHAAHPTGLLREEECFKITWGLADAPDHIKDQWVAEASAKAAGRGVTGIVDLDLTWALPDWQRREAAGLTAHRVECGVISDSLDQALAEGLRTGQVMGTSGLLTVGPLKIIADGSLNTRTAWCCDPYPGMSGPEAYGIAAHSAEELRDLLRRAAAGGLVPAVHAIGDRANAEVLDAFAAVGCGGRIEHAQLLRRADVARLAPLGVTASVQPEHAMDDRDVAERHWPASYNRAFMLRSLLEAGARLAFGSDAPVAPLDPWITLAAAVTRSRDGREPWQAGEAVTVRQGIAASSRGRLTPRVGEVGDLQLVDYNPLTADADQLRHMPVAATWLAGRLTHSAE